MRRLLVLCLVGAVSARGRPSLAGYLDACEGPGDAVHLRRWYGRTGNNLNQLANAFGVALASGRPYVSLPAAPPKGLDPAVWRVPPASLPAGRRDGAQFRCEAFDSEPTYDCARLFRSRCRLSVAERRVALRRAVDALLRPEALDACDAPGKGAVVAHVRDGDVARDDLCGNQIFNVRVIERFGPDSSTALRELDESDRCVQKSAESTSI